VSGPFYFAWAGGAIEEQVTVTTTGTTHGAAFETVTLIADAAGRQLQNLASNQGLEAGALYSLAGPGISAGTYFLYDDSILAGAPGSINLSNLVTGTHASATYQATKAAPVGTVLGTLAAGSNAVTLDAGDLPAGVYGVFGIGIGETDVPLSTTEGSWSITPDGFDYQWYAGHHAIDGATHATYVVSPAEAGHKIHVVVTAKHEGYTSLRAGSATTDRVVFGRISFAKPTLRGHAVVGRTLTARLESLQPKAATPHYAWYRDSDPIHGSRAPEPMTSHALSAAAEITGVPAGSPMTAAASSVRSPSRPPGGTRSGNQDGSTAAACQRQSPAFAQARRL